MLNPMKKVVIGAPFGNYSWYREIMPTATPTFGTFTLRRRAGPLKRAWRVLKTLRYSPAIGGWINRLGLPNPGLHAFVEAVQRHTESAARRFSLLPHPIDHGILSVALLTRDADLELLQILRIVSSMNPRPRMLEVNVSCPNVEHSEDLAISIGEAFAQYADFDLPVSVKLPPVGYEPFVERLEAITTVFHCCNTLPVAAGGASGPILRPFVFSCIDYVRENAPASLVLAGGGVRDWDSASAYLERGAHAVSIASLLINPFNWRSAYRLSNRLTDLR